MSSGGGGYVVVSAEELERRALLVARDHYARVATERAGVVAALEGFGESVPAARAASGDSTAVTAAAARLEADLAGLRARLTELRVAAALAGIPRVRIELTERQKPVPAAGGAATGKAASGPATYLTDADSDPAVAIGQAYELVAKLVRLTGAPPAADLLRRRALVTADAEPTQRRMALADLRYAVQQARDAHRAAERARKANEALREQVLAALDGCSGAPAVAAREAVARVPAGDPVPLGLDSARALAAAESRSADAAFVQAAVADVLAGMGYDVGGSMSVMVAERGALLGLPGHDDHVGWLREQDGELRYGLLRVAGDAADAEGDLAAEEVSCEVLEGLRAGLAEAGVEWSLSRFYPAGVRPPARARTVPAPPLARDDGGGRAGENRRGRRSAAVQRERERRR